MSVSIRAAVAQYSARPGAPHDPHSLDSADIVVVPPPNLFLRESALKATLEEGFGLARRLLDEGRPVRLVGEGATLAGSWPEWAGGEPRLLVTELGAYRSETASSHSLRRAIRTWIDATFAGTLPQALSPSDVLYTAACSRLFQPLFYAVPYVSGLTACHPTARFHCADVRWVGLSMLGRLVGRGASGGGASVAPQRMSGWGAALACASIWGVVRAAAGHVRAFYRSRHGRAWLRRMRSTATPPPPDMWLAVVPCWGERANRHVMAAVGWPALRRGVRVGVLLTTSLDGGSEARPDTHAAALWPALAEIMPPAQDVVVDQAAAPESLRDLGANLLMAAVGAWRVVRRLALNSRVDNGPLQFNLHTGVQGLARLVGTDLVAAIAAVRATNVVLTRYSRRVPVVFSMLASVESAAVDACCRRDQFPTIDFVHGTGADLWDGATETRAIYRAVWTMTDADTVSALGQRPIVAGMSYPTPAAPANPGASRRVLIVSNYVHAGWGPVGYPLRPHQDELLSVVDRLRARFGQRFEFRWRPHPWDEAAHIDPVFERYPGLGRSTGSLAEDFGWSDLIISTNSSAAIEALLWERPVFLHVTPAQRHLPEVRAFAPERLFFYATELTDRFAQCVALMDAGDSGALRPERVARMSIHGAAQTSKHDSVLDMFQSLTERRHAGADEPLSRAAAGSSSH